MSQINRKMLDEEKSNGVAVELADMRTRAVQQCREWLDDDMEAKQPYEAEMEEMYKLYKSAHWDLLDETGRVLRTDAQKQNHPNAVENVVFAMIDGLIAEFSTPKELVDYPTEEGDDDLATKLTDIKEYIAYKNRLDKQTIKFLWTFFLYGTGIKGRYWDPTWKGGKGPNRWDGEIRWIAEHPKYIFPDARCTESFEDGRRIHKAIPRTIEDVEETWEGVENILADYSTASLAAMEELEQTSVDALKDQIWVGDTWYKGKPLILEEGEEDQGPGMHLIQWAGLDNPVYLAHSNYYYFDPEEDDRFPIQGYKCYEREGSPWGISEAYQIKNPQIIMNKTAEIIIESHIHEALGQTVYEASAVSDKQKKMFKEKGTLAGMWFEVNDINGVQRIYGKGTQASLSNEMSRLQRSIETIVGRFDISQGKTPGSVTAFRALDLIASRAQVRLKAKEMIINTSFEDDGNYINHLITRFYDNKRKYRILGEGGDKPTFGALESNELKRVYLFAEDVSLSMDEFEASIVGQEMLPPEQQMIEGKDYEIYSPEFDTRCKVTSTMPSDRVFYMEMAKELYIAQLIDHHIFWYVIDNGKFPPIEEVLQHIEQQQQQQAQAEMQGAGGQMPGAEPQIPPEMAQEIQEFILYLQENNPEILQQLGQMPEEQQIPALVGLMEQMKQEGGTQAPPGADIPANAPANASVDAEEAQRIRQELINLAQSGE